MLKGGKILTLFVRKPQFLFANDKIMKERDEAAQKVYISQQEKEQMKKLLEKLSKQKQLDSSKDGEFERRLDEILKRYRITNTQFAAQILNLHRQH